MTNSKNKLTGILLAVLMGISTVAVPSFMTTMNSTKPVCFIQTIEANAATLYAPKLTNGHYIIGYCTSDSNVPVYADKNFKKRGAASSKNGKASYYNAYVSGGSDEIKIYDYTSSWCYISYPAGKTTKFGFIKTSAVFPMNETKNQYTASSKTTTYKKNNLKTSYGYIAKGDTVYTVGKSENNYKVIYNISGGNWKMAWIGDNSSSKYSTGTYQVNTNAGINVRDGAGTNSKVLGSANNGTQFNVTKTSGNWGYTNSIKCTNGTKSGWICLDYCKKAEISDDTALSYGLYHSNSARITCPFDGYTTTKGRHEGIDISYYVGAPIYSLTDGEVVRVANGYNGKDGLSTIAIYVPSQNKTVIYLHCAPSNLKAGDKIKKGQQIGTQAWRGISSKSGSHTHVEVRNGRQGYACKSVNDYTLENSNPTSFWKTMGYYIG